MNMHVLSSIPVKMSTNFNVASRSGIVLNCFRDIRYTVEYPSTGLDNTGLDSIRIIFPDRPKLGKIRSWET